MSESVPVESRNAQVQSDTGPAVMKTAQSVPLESETDHPTPSPSALLHLLTLKHLSDSGFASTSRAASITLSSVLEKYLLATASACVQKAEYAGRRKVGALDLVQVLEERQGPGALDELEIWVGRQDREEWAGDGFERGLEGLEEQLENGLTLPQPVADLVAVPTEDEGMDLDEEEYSSGSEGDEGMNMDGPARPVRAANAEARDTTPDLPPLPVRVGSPDMSWLPPLPTALDTTTENPSSALRPAHDFSQSLSARSHSQPSRPTTEKNDELTNASSLYAKFTTSLAFADSQISASFIDPLDQGPLTKPAYEAPPPRSTLPSLLKAYEALKGEGSVSLAQTPLRMQAGDLLKRVICPPDFDAAPDTLSFPLEGPKMSLGMASYSRPVDEGAGEVSPDAATGGRGVLPEPRIPVNPHPDGVLARLVREMRSPYLPPAVRDRMLHISPPPALIAKDGSPILYGAPVRGPDRAALELARGKPVPEDGAEEYYRYTYDPGPMGMEKWGRKLDIKTMGTERNRRIEASSVGEEVPRTAKKEGTQQERGAVDRTASAVDTDAGPVQVRLKLDRTHTAPHVDVSVRDQQGDETSHDAGAAGVVGTVAAILENAAEHADGDVVMAEAYLGAPQSGHPNSATSPLAAVSPAARPSPRTSLTLNAPKIRISTGSASPAAPTAATPAGTAQSPAVTARSPLPTSAPPSATPPPAPPTPATPSAGGVRIRLGGSFSAPKRSAESPADGAEAQMPRGGSPVKGNDAQQQGEEPPTKRPNLKFRFSAASVKQEP